MSNNVTTSTRSRALSLIGISLSAIVGVGALSSAAVAASNGVTCEVSALYAYYEVDATLQTDNQPPTLDELSRYGIDIILTQGKKKTMLHEQGLAVQLGARPTGRETCTVKLLDTNPNTQAAIDKKTAEEMLAIADLDFNYGGGNGSIANYDAATAMALTNIVLAQYNPQWSGWNGDDVTKVVRLAAKIEREGRQMPASERPVGMTVNGSNGEVLTYIVDDIDNVLRDDIRKGTAPQ